MAMPEATVNKDDRPIFGEYDVRLARELVVVKLVPVAQCVEAASNDEFGLCILATNTRHHAAAGNTVDDIRHDQGCSCISRCRWPSAAY